MLRFRMKKVPTVVAICCAAALTACAAHRPAMEEGPEVMLAQAVQEIEEGEYRAAYERLTRIYTNHWERPVARQALLVLAGLELDPRNVVRRPWASSDFAGLVLQRGDAEPWVEATASALYLLALELGAEQTRPADMPPLVLTEALPPGVAPAPLARLHLPGRTIPERMAAIAEERDELRDEVERLERQLRRSRAELDRIRRTLRP